MIHLATNEELDLAALRDRLLVVLPQLAYELIELMHSETRDSHPALTIETDDRKKGHVYRMVVAVIDGCVNFFLHVWGASKDLTTQGTDRFRKECADLDEVFAIVHRCWTGGPS